MHDSFDAPHFHIARGCLQRPIDFRRRFCRPQDVLPDLRRHLESSRSGGVEGTLERGAAGPHKPQGALLCRLPASGGTGTGGTPKDPLGILGIPVEKTLQIA